MITDLLDTTFLFFSKNMVYTATPITTLTRYLDNKEIISYEDKIILIFNNTVHELNAITTTEKFLEEIKKCLSLEYEEQYIKKVRNFMGLAEMILQKKAMKLLYDNRIYPYYMNNQLYLCKQILAYTIKYGNTRYDFTGCTIFIKMKDNDYYTKPSILEDEKYIHPHVYSDNTICLGSYKLTYSLEGAVQALKTTEQVLVSGHFGPGELHRLNLRNYPNKKGGFIT